MYPLLPAVVRKLRERTLIQDMNAKHSDYRWNYLNFDAFVPARMNANPQRKHDHIIRARWCDLQASRDHFLCRVMCLVFDILEVGTVGSGGSTDFL